MALTSEIWKAFAKSSAMLAFVIALLLLILYGVNRFSSLRGKGRGRKEIEVISVHHLAPKEKLVLVDVLDRRILLGITAQTITPLATFDRDKTLPKEEPEFSELLHSELIQESVGRSREKVHGHEA